MSPKLSTIVFLSCVLTMMGCTSPSGISGRKSAGVSASLTPEVAVRQLFEEYKARDLANDPKIMELYADNASVALSGKVYDKTAYGQIVETAYKSAAGAANKATEYTDISIDVVNSKEAWADFSATLGPIKTNVHWKLTRNSPSEKWQIESESFGFG